MDKFNAPSDQTIKLTSLKVYPAVLAAVGIAIALLAIGRYWGASQQSASTDVDPSRLSLEIPLTPADPTNLTSPSNITGDPLNAEQATNSTPTGNESTTTVSSAPLASNLRVSNRTVHPVRVALLAHANSVSDSSSATDPQSSTTYDVPVHWDFAPGEGSQAGLLLSLPDESVQLKAGDILVAFAQDGSRIYWGPYVVDQTDRPLWNENQQEWQLILQP